MTALPAGAVPHDLSALADDYASTEVRPLVLALELARQGHPRLRDRADEIEALLVEEIDRTIDLLLVGRRAEASSADVERTASAFEVSCPALLRWAREVLASVHRRSPLEIVAAWEVTARHSHEQGDALAAEQARAAIARWTEAAA